MPALATAMVTGPSARSAAAKKACTDFSSRTSPTPAKVRSPPSPAAACSTASLRRSPTATRPPAAWNAWAMPWPMPAPAPVTTTMALLKSKPLMPAACRATGPSSQVVNQMPLLTPHIAYQILGQRHARRPPLMKGWKAFRPRAGPVPVSSRELWHGTMEGEHSELRRIDPETGEVLERLEMPAGVAVTGLEADGAGVF